MNCLYLKIGVFRTYLLKSIFRRHLMKFNRFIRINVVCFRKNMFCIEIPSQLLIKLNNNYNLFILKTGYILIKAIKILILRGRHTLNF